MKSKQTKFSCDLKELDRPFWLGNVRLHQSHMSNLLRKNPEYYSEFAKFVPDNLEYYWPVV
jgi:hypothetical protein